MRHKLCRGLSGEGGAHLGYSMCAMYPVYALILCLDGHALEIAHCCVVWFGEIVHCCEALSKFLISMYIFPLGP